MNKFLVNVLFFIFKVFYDEKYWAKQAQFSPHSKKDIFVANCIGYIILCFLILAFGIGMVYISKGATTCNYYPSKASCILE